jgi:hypothetical protein
MLRVVVERIAALACVVVVLGTVAPAQSVPPGNRHPDLSVPPLLTAIARADNDCVPDEPYADRGAQQVSLPAAVRNKIHAVTLADFQSRNFEILTRLATRYGPVFRVTPPRASHRHLYVFKLRTVMDLFDLVLILHDRRTDAVTPRPVRFSTRWMSRRKGWRLVKPPLVRFDDLDQDGQDEIVYQVRIHNGTMINAVAYHYLHVGHDTSLAEVFVRETRLVNLFAPAGDPHAFILRDIEKLGPGRIRLRTTLADTPFRSGGDEAGSVELCRERPGSRFRESARRVRLPRYERLLLNVCGD